MNLKNILKGQVILEEADSPVNGKISVVKSLGLGTYFQVGNLTQSGGIVYDIWKKTLEKVKTIMMDPKSVLILGLGGGSCAKLSRKNWPNAEITGVDFDRMIVELGLKYLGLKPSDSEIIVSDAYEYVEKVASENRRFDLVIVDLYAGQEFPVVFENETFLENVKKILSENGIVVFNRLYSAEKRPYSMKFGKVLQKFFPRVDYFYPEANVMFICVK